MDSCKRNWFVTNLKQSSWRRHCKNCAKMEQKQYVFKLSGIPLLEKNKESLTSCCSHKNRKHCKQEGAHDCNSWISCSQVKELFA